MTSSASHCIQDGPPENFKGLVKSSEQKGQIISVYDSRNNKDAFNQELDGLDSFIDFEMNPEGFMTTVWRWMMSQRIDVHALMLRLNLD